MILCCLFESFTQAQDSDSVTVGDYQRAVSMLSFQTALNIDYDSVVPHWINGDKFWYRRTTSSGREFILVDPVKKKRMPAFDHQKTATALSSATGNRYVPERLPFLLLDFSPEQKNIFIKVKDKNYKVNLENYLIVEDSLPGKSDTARSNEILSPDKKSAAFVKDYNLWVRDIDTGKRTQLTTDGIKNYGYATDNAGWRQSKKPIIKWSPDSRKIATYRQDERLVGNMYLVSTNVGHPVLKSWKYPLPGDSNIIMIERVIINVEDPEVIKLRIPADPHRSSLGDDISQSGSFTDVQWTEDGSQIAFVTTSRDHKNAKFRIANAVTGEVREVFEENVSTQYESGQGAVNWRYLPQSKEVIWYSERDDWGHLYLYDAETGKLKSLITKGEYAVTQLKKVDEKNKTIIFQAVGKDTKNPYFSHLYKIGLNGKNTEVLTPEEGDHEITFSPSGKYFIDNYSQPDVPNIIVLRDVKGDIILPLEKTDISRLQVAGWYSPKTMSVKAADGKTDLHGLLFTPSNLDKTKKYPVVDYIYPGPQGGSVGSWSFAASRKDHQALAELGFIVVVLEGSSNPLRSKSFHDMSYGNMAENTLPDQIAGIRELSEKYNFMDTTRIGIWGHSGGGFATAAAMFRYPEFFKVGISESGNHDNRNYEDDWGERYVGLLTRDENGLDNYEAQANQVYAKNLKGKLLVAHGMMDDNVPPYNTFLVVEALEKANKDFDLIIFPNSKHGYGDYSNYMMRRRWDYFVENLAGKKHPKEFKIVDKKDPRTKLE